ncbi:FAD-binding protein [Aliidiomarina halalkaliphila]|uniref:FAD-binding protein n=1 Tax=Aliidiomarina halalkaliphila TaxID=2593535 RepID=A0A552X1E3_9GAMM|nr:GMC family oxidoreductase [Aliidiomarina halalkaliphila]TRW48862.1 FAD-binding protein [Aliidiomarina halalkaliphila]
MNKDVYTLGMDRGWNIIDARSSTQVMSSPDVIIIGSGAGGATAAAALAKFGKRVLILEEGSLKTAKDFHNDELKAYAELYQEGALRTSKDGGISILQGRTVGGTTTVNWTSSFRTPASTLSYWRTHFGIADAQEDLLRPYFERIEQRLHIERWAASPNENNAVIQRGCDRLGWQWDVIPRNVQGCWNLGYCGTGCPTNAKQSMLVTSIPEALDHGAQLIHSTRVQQLVWDNDRVTGVICQPMDSHLHDTQGDVIHINAPLVILAGGAINSPGVLLRSQVPNPHRTLGRRTFLHPVCMNMAVFDHAIDGFYGAPQSIYSDEFNAIPDGPELGFKIEVAPMQPSIVSALMGEFGEQHHQRMQQLANSNLMLALMRDGFHQDDPGGQVELRKNGDAVLDYPLRAHLWATCKQAFLRMAKVQFAAGARSVMPVHALGQACTSLAEYETHLQQLPMRIFDVRLSSAHVMGGCGMSQRPEDGVVDPSGRHHQLHNLYIFDGSIFPSSIGANPQMSIYAWTQKLTEALIERLR